MKPLRSGRTGDSIGCERGFVGEGQAMNERIVLDPGIQHGKSRLSGARACRWRGLWVGRPVG